MFFSSNAHLPDWILIDTLPEKHCAIMAVKQAQIEENDLSSTAAVK